MSESGIETTYNNSRIPPLNKLVTRTSFTLSYDLLKKLKRYAIDNDQTLTAVVNDALYEFLDKRNRYIFSGLNY